MIKITPNIFLLESEVKISFIRAPGPGGQNVNKVASAVHLRFNVLNSSSLPEEMRRRLIILMGKRLTSEGELVIKASRYRTQERNKQDALFRLQTLLKQAAISPKKRKKTKPGSAVIERRLTQKKLRAKVKSLRQSKIKNEE